MYELHLVRRARDGRTVPLWASRSQRVIRAALGLMREEMEGLHIADDPEWQGLVNAFRSHFERLVREVEHGLR